MENEKIAKYFNKIDSVYPPIYSNFVRRYSAMLFDLVCLENKKLYELVKKPISSKKYDNLDLNTCVKLAQSFFNSHNIIVSIKDLYDKKTLRFVKSDEKNNTKFYNIEFSPASFQIYNNKDGKYLSVVVSGNIVDAFTIVHEVCHYRNQPNRYRSYVSDMLTESISYAMALIFAYDLMKKNYKIDDTKKFILNNNLELYDYAYNLYPTFSFIYLYNTFNEISEDIFNKFFVNSNYQKILEHFKVCVKQNRDYIKDVWNFLGRSLSIYLFTQYVKDNNYIEKIEKLNKELNNRTFEDCIQIIDIYGPNDLVYKMSKSINSSIKLIEELFNIK